MPPAGTDDFTCSNCGNCINEDDDFCPHCGAIFASGVFCEKHRRTEAAGVCIVCAEACCDGCGKPVNGIFLCNTHAGYEIFGGMVKVYGTSDAAEADITRSRLEEGGLHPALFHIHRLRGGLVQYEPSTDGEEFSAGELKLMVPCQEVAEAEKILRAPMSH